MRLHVFCTIVIIFVILLLAPTIMMGKVNLHLLTNQYWNPVFDSIFLVITQLVEGPIIIGIILVLIFRRKWIWAIALILILSTTTIYLLKNYMFAEMMRPAVLIPHLRIVEGYYNEINFFKTFPSGHTAASFAFLGYLTLMIKNKYISLGLITLMISIGISRIYLSQHFAMDVAVGAIIGSLITILTYYFQPKKLKP